MIRNFRYLILAAFALAFAPLFAQTVAVDFDQAEFDRLAELASQKYIDPDRLQPSLAYSSAADTALRSLPYPLLLWPRRFYDRRSEFRDDVDIPGRPVESGIAGDFVIFRPDHAAWQEQLNAYRLNNKARLERMTPAERLQETDRLRQRRREALQFIDQSWKESAFGRDQYLAIMQWLSNRWSDYATPPPGVGAAQLESFRGFGMHRLYFAAINGYLSSLDPHSSVVTRADWEKIISEAANSSFEGIGALLRGGGSEDVVIETPLANSPALAAGVRAGDIVRKVDGRSVANLQLDDIVRMIRGPRDSIVELEVERLGEATPTVLRIKRGLIEQRAVSSEYLSERKVGVIRVTSFLYKDRNTDDMVLEEFQRLRAQAEGKLKALVIDLRGNSGGHLIQAVRLAGLFIPPHAAVVTVRTGDGRAETHGSPVNRPLRDPRVDRWPLIVLINSQSASASEIFASALMDHNAALIVGERSFGKATVQDLIPSGSNLLKITTARYYAPHGYTCQIFGVRPDIEISDEGDNGFPTRFREEDMFTHLPELSDRPADPARNAWIGELRRASAQLIQTTEADISRRGHDARRPDYMLLRALAFAPALERNPLPGAGVSTVQRRLAR
ncbi:MAG: PDZ domain-containing protein [Leptospirales bacterium]|nr:PDZ domain-containing protein [Leptospirales bacterium]